MMKVQDVLRPTYDIDGSASAMSSNNRRYVFALPVGAALCYAKMKNHRSRLNAAMAALQAGILRSRPTN